MTAETAHLKAVVYGTLASGRQTWSLGVNLGGNLTGISGPDSLSALAQQLYADFLSAGWTTAAAPATSIKALAGTSSKVDGVRLYGYIGNSDALAQGQSSGASVAGTGSPSAPPQTALVASLLTGYPGRSQRGRVYLPYLVTNMSSADGTIAGGYDGPCAAFANVLSLWRTRTYNGQFCQPIVYSRTGRTYEPILRVQVDNVADTQRRRRDKILPSARASANLVVG